MALSAIQSKFAPFSKARLGDTQVKVTLRPDNIPLAYGYPFPGSFPIDQLVASASEALKTEGTGALQYGGGPSVRGLRSLLAKRFLARGLTVPDDEVMVTTGSNQAIDLTARLFLSHGDRAMCEAPTFFAAMRIMQLTEAEVIGMPVDEHGLDVDYLERWLKGERAAGRSIPKLFYCIANFQNPTGTTLTMQRREKFLALAREYDFVILEDDAYGELWFNNPPPTAMRAMDKEGRVIYTSTFSKIVAPGVRLGWAVATPEIIGAFNSLKSDGGTGPLAQAIVYHYCEGNSLDARISWLRSEYMRRYKAMEAALKKYMPADSTFAVPKGGFFVWLTIPGVDTKAMYPDAVANGVTYVDGPQFFPDGSGAASMRLCFSFCDEATITEGIKRLAEVTAKHKK
jgi:2-aminoadipate transaminase